MRQSPAASGRRSAGPGPGRWALAAAAGIALDGRFGEPPLQPHPLVVFGRVMRASEARLWRDDRLAGLVHAAGGVGIGLAAGRALGSSTLATYLAVAGRALDRAAVEVEQALAADDLAAAREALPALVGRDPSGLDASELARAVIESLAENTVDAVVAPACWAAVAGAPGALGYRAVNTLDAMVGHRSARYERFGWASARLDDVANLVPARLTAALVAVVRPSSAGAVWRAVRDDAPAHPSPNSGVAEAAFAAALGLRLGGTSRYGDRIEHRPSLGTGRAAEPADIAAARRLARDVANAMALTFALVGVATAAHRRLGARTVSFRRRADQLSPAACCDAAARFRREGGDLSARVLNASAGTGRAVQVPVPLSVDRANAQSRAGRRSIRRGRS